MKKHQHAHFTEISPGNIGFTQLVVQHLFHVIKPVPGSNSLTEFVEYLVIRPGFTGGFHHFIMGLDHKTRVHIVDFVHFQPVGGG